jgi:hypothetical protein
MIVKNTLLSQNLLSFPGCAILWSPLLYSWENNHAEIKYYIIYFTTHSIVFSTQNLNLNRLKNEYYFILWYIWNYEKLLTSLKITTVPLPPTYVNVLHHHLNYFVPRYLLPLRLRRRRTVLRYWTTWYSILLLHKFLVILHFLCVL